MDNNDSSKIKIKNPKEFKKNKCDKINSNFQVKQIITFFEVKHIQSFFFAETNFSDI